MVGLSGIRGQDRAREIVRRALASGKLPHAYLFAGPDGVGKRTAALALAAALNCEREPGAAHCECGPCEKIAAGLHPDVLLLAPGGTGKQIVIEQVREVMAALGYPPHEGRARVIIVDDADKMNPAAQNAFLKTLEEPPARTHVILCSTAPDRLLVTIRSRCQRVRFAPLAVEVVVGLLRAQGVDDGVARQAARVAGGSVARASELAGGEAATARWERVQKVVHAVRGQGVRVAVEAAAALAEEKDDLPATLELLACFYRDAAAIAAGRAGGGGGEYDDEAAAEAARVGGPALLARRAAVALDAHGAVLGYAAANLTVESMILALRAGDEA
jgi:DNA polymerase-3 subunit delta'